MRLKQSMKQKEEGDSLRRAESLLRYCASLHDVATHSHLKAIVVVVSGQCLKF